MNLFGLVGLASELFGLVCSGERSPGPQRGQPPGGHRQADPAQDGDAEQDASGQRGGQVRGLRNRTRIGEERFGKVEVW